MAGISAIDDCTVLQTRDSGRGTDPPRPMLTRVRANKLHPPLAQRVAVDRIPQGTPSSSSGAAARQNAQLPAFAPLLEELEIAGWSSRRRMLSGNFHDWSLLDGRKLLVMAGHAVAAQSNEAIDPIEAALVAQGAWASLRSHAHHSCDAGTLLSLAALSLWSNVGAGVQAAVALVDLDGGHASVAVAGDCLAIRILRGRLGADCRTAATVRRNSDFTYRSHAVQLSLRERILLVADEPLRRPAKLASRVAANFSRLDVESHRRMMAADAIAVVRDEYERAADDGGRPSASIVAVRRR